MKKTSQSSSSVPPTPPDPGSELPTPTPEDLEHETAPEIRVVEKPEGEVEGEDSEAARRYKDRWLRAEAELQNYRRRAQREREESERRAEERVLMELIEQLDDLERALAAATDATDRWVAGVRLVAAKMTDTLSRYGVTAVATDGRSFDPEVHEAMLEIDAPEGTAPGGIVEVIRRGYRRGSRVLRAARVVVARTPADRT